MANAHNQSADCDMLLLTIRNKYNSLSNAVRRVADYILEHYEEAVYLNIIQIAEKSGVSEATVTKFARMIGYGSFQELKISLARAVTKVNTDETAYVGDIPLKGSIEGICESVFLQSMESIRDTLKLLDVKGVERAAKKISAARKTDFYGTGSAWAVAEYAHLRFYRLGVITNAYADRHQQAISASLLTKNDVAVGISNSGQSAEVVQALGLAKQSGATTVCITNYDNSPIVKQSDIVLFTSSKDSQVLNESLCSRVAEICIVDALYASVISKNKDAAIRSLDQSTKVIEKQRLPMD